MRSIPVIIVSAILPLLTGCSNAPLAGTMDTLFPSKAMKKRGNPDPKDIFDKDRDPLPEPTLRDRNRELDDALPPPRGVGERMSLPRTEKEPTGGRGDPFRPRKTDDDPPPLPAPGFLDPIGPGRN